MQADHTVEADHPPEGRFVHVDGWRVHCITAGTGRDVLLIHGAGGSTRDMTFRLLPLLSKDFRVTAIDRPAHGWTSGPAEKTTISPQAQASLLLKVVETLGLDTPIVLGQSYGGAVALAMALQEPAALSGLCLVSAATCDAIPTGTQSLEMLTRLDTVRAVTLATISSPRFIELALAKLFSPQAIPQGYEEHLGIRMSYRERTFRLHMLQASGLAGSLREMMPDYAGIRMPVEIIHGDADPILDCASHAEWIAGQIPRAGLTVLPGIGHMPHHVATEDVARCVFRTASRR